MSDVAVCPECRGSGGNSFYVGTPCHLCEGWRVVLVPPRPSTVRDEGDLRSVFRAINTPPRKP